MKHNDVIREEALSKDRPRWVVIGCEAYSAYTTGEFLSLMPDDELRTFLLLVAEALE